MLGSVPLAPAHGSYACSWFAIFSLHSERWEARRWSIHIYRTCAPDSTSSHATVNVGERSIGSSTWIVCVLLVRHLLRQYRMMGKWAMVRPHLPYIRYRFDIFSRHSECWGAFHWLQHMDRMRAPGSPSSHSIANDGKLADGPSTSTVHVLPIRHLLTPE